MTKRKMEQLEMEKPEKMKEKTEETKEEEKLKLLKAFEDCKNRSAKFKPREYLCPSSRNFPFSDILNSGKGIRPNLFTNKLNEAHELAKSEDVEELAKAKAIFHEALFLIERKETAKTDSEKKRYAEIPDEKANEIRSAYEETWNKVEEKDINDLRELQENRDKFLDELSALGDEWMEHIFLKCYCEGLIYSCAVMSEHGSGLDKEKIIDMIRKYKHNSAEDATEIVNSDKQSKAIRSLIQAYAFLIYSLTIDQSIDREFVQKIHAKVCEEKEKGGKIVSKERRLKILLSWLSFHFLCAHLDPVTLATIAHYGIVLLRPFIDANQWTGRILQDFILMSSGYPPACIFANDLFHYKELEMELKQFEGTDLRPFLRFISAKCMPKTFNAILNKKVDTAEMDEIVSTSSQKIENRPSSFASSDNSVGKSQNFGKGQIPLSAKSSLEGSSSMKNEEEEEAEEDEEEEEIVNPWAEIFKHVLGKFNPELLKAAEPIELPPLPVKHVYNGWAEIFKHVLAKFNPDLLEFE